MRNGTRDRDARWLPLVAALAVSAFALRLSMAAEVIGPSQVYLRGGPGTSFPPAGTLEAGQKVTIVEKLGNWTRIRTEGGKDGYVYDGYLEYAEAELPPPGAPSATSPP